MTVLKVPMSMVSSSNKRSEMVSLDSPVTRMQPWICCLKAGSQAGSVVVPVTTPGSAMPLFLKEADASASWPAEKIGSPRSSVIPSWNKIDYQTGLRKVQELLTHHSQTG